jgi:hypothetical protein
MWDSPSCPLSLLAVALLPSIPFAVMVCSFFFHSCFFSLSCDKYLKSLPTSNNVESVSIILPFTCCCVGHKIAFTYTQGDRVFACVIASKASCHRVCQLMDGVNWQNRRVYIWQTSTQVVVQRCGLTSDRKTAPRPPAPAHPRQSQYMWTSKMDTPRTRLQQCSTTSVVEDVQFNELLHVFLGTLQRPATPANRTWTQKSWKNLDGSRSPSVRPLTALGHGALGKAAHGHYKMSFF